MTLVHESSNIRSSGRKDSGRRENQTKGKQRRLREDIFINNSNKREDKQSRKMK